MRKILYGAAFAAALLAVSPASAQVIEGRWSYDDNPGGGEILILENIAIGKLMRLQGTATYCGSLGDRYTRVRAVLRASGPVATWRITDTCNDGTVRICIDTLSGVQACSTYLYDRIFE